VNSESLSKHGEAVVMPPNTTWIGRFVDSELVLPADLSADRLERQESDRLVRSLTVVLMASTVPRRLGGEASSEELALDKRRCRRVSWAIRQSALQWTKRVELPSPIPEELRIEGAQLEWETFGQEHLTLLIARVSLSATWAARSDEKVWGMKAVTKFENERRWVTHALR
jgi:hypothetical protein